MVQTIESSRPIIKVIYDQSLQDDDIPYRARVNAPQVSRLLLEHGMPTSQLSETTIRVTRKPADAEDQEMMGGYNDVIRQVELYTDNAWRHGRKGRKRLSEFLIHELRHAIDHDEIVKYHQDIPVQTLALKGAGVLIPIVGFVSMIAGTALTDQEVNPLVPIGSSVAIIAGTVTPTLAEGLDYLLNPYERRARRFAKETGQLPEWQNLAILKPKNQNWLESRVDNLVQSFI
jgi:hypothetical protein